MASPPPAPSTGEARVLVAAAALLFSTGGVAIKLSALSGVQIAGLRSAIAALALWVCVPRWRPSLDVAELTVALPYAGTLILYAIANTLTTAAHSIFLQSTAPLYVLILAPRWLGEPARRSDWGLVALIGAGLALIFATAQPALRTAPAPALGNGLALASGLTWALTLMGLRWLGARAAASRRGDAAGSAVVTGNLLAAALCAPGLLPLAAQPIDWGVVGYLGAAQVALAYLCLVRGVRGLPVLEYTLLLCAEPALSALWAWIVHGEVPAPGAQLGCGLIALALLGQALRPAR